MDNSLVRAFLWRDVIRLGFSPSGNKNKITWLHQYGESLQSFWQTESGPKPPKLKNGKLCTTFDCLASVNISFEYAIEPTNKFTVRIMSPLQGLLWVHDYQRNAEFERIVDLFDVAVKANKYFRILATVIVDGKDL
jgi:hypothetical protein